MSSPQVAGPAPEGLRARLSRWLVEPDYPLVAIEVRPRSLGVVRLTREHGQLALAAAASLNLPDGALNVSMVQPNVVDKAAFQETLRGVLERAGVPVRGPVCLVLPDPVARVALLPVAEVRGKDEAETLELIRFRMKKAVPFEIKDARVSFVMPEGAPEAMVVAVAMFLPVLEGYEKALAELGLEPGVVDLSGLSILQAVEAFAPARDRLLVNWDEGYVSLLLARGGDPLLFRTLAGDAASTLDDVVREVANTVLYHHDKLGGTALSSAVVRSAVLPLSQAVELLRDPIGMEPEVLDLGTAMGGADRGPVAQAVAGAASCLIGRLS